MFFRKREKETKRVICPIPVILQIMQDAIDGDEGGARFNIRFANRDYRVGFTSDFTHRQGFFDPIFYLDEQEFSTFEDFKTQAVFNGALFSTSLNEVEIYDVDDGENLVKFPWYTKLEDYVVV